MDKVAQLVKLAKEKDHDAGLKATGAAGVAAYNASKVPSRLLGYHNVYHGASSRENASNIREKGLKKSKGGSGVSRNDDSIKNGGRSDHVKRSKGNIYFSKSKDQAMQYTRGLFNPMGDRKRLIKAKISHDHYTNRSVKDSLTSKLIDESGQGAFYGEKARKAQAAKSNKSISPSQIKGSSKYKGRRQFATKKNMKNYLGSGSGKKRFAHGLANAALSAGSGLYALRKAREARQN